MQDAKKDEMTLFQDIILLEDQTPQDSLLNLDFNAIMPKDPESTISNHGYELNLEPLLFDTPAPNPTISDIWALENSTPLLKSNMEAMFASTATAKSPTVASPSRASKSICRIEGCTRRIRSKGLCKAHGGGRQCEALNCTKSAHNGKFCIGHGGGKRCKHDRCSNASQSKGLCKAHGGGARCKIEGCTKSSQGRGLCRAHGGGRRCEAAGCDKGAQRGKFCATHGGFRKCSVADCSRTDRGGGVCEVHREGRMCGVERCKKLSRSNGLCASHLREWREQAKPLPSANSLFNMLSWLSPSHVQL